MMYIGTTTVVKVLGQELAYDNDYLSCLVQESVQPLSHIITGSPPHRRVNHGWLLEVEALKWKDL